ncbi:MAG: MobA/MobL family protein [Sphingomonadales bacterium]|nr:MobA/MobL family protein [Sphingomonadales bacterium]
MFISQSQIRQARQQFVTRPRSISRIEWPDFKVRPISEEWQYCGRVPAYKTAVANTAYIWRESEPVDRFGPMPARFAERRFELKGSGLLLPTSAPLWAVTDPYKVWAEADAAALATGDPTAVAAWHVMMEIPLDVRPDNWRWLCEGFLHSQLVQQGATVAWAIHAVQGDDGDWIIKPHMHAIVTARYWRHDRRQGRRHPNWIGSWAQQKRMEFAWRRRCSSMRDLMRAGFYMKGCWPPLTR